MLTYPTLYLPSGILIMCQTVPDCRTAENAEENMCDL
jgi:hypothetical protein